MAPLIIQLVENQSWIQNNQNTQWTWKILSSIEVPVKKFALSLFPSLGRFFNEGNMFAYNVSSESFSKFTITVVYDSRRNSAQWQRVFVRCLASPLEERNGLIPDQVPVMEL